MSTFWQQVQQLPRSGRWAVYGAAILLALALYSYGVLPVAADWNTKADRIQNALDKARASSEPKRINEIESVIRSMGPAQAPASESVTSQEMLEAVTAALDGKVYSKYGFNTESPRKMPTGVLRGMVAPDERAEYILGRLDFESTIETAMNVIAALESSPAIESVKSVRLTKLGGTDKRVSVKLELEAWAVSKTTAAAGPGGRR